MPNKQAKKQGDSCEKNKIINKKKREGGGRKEKVIMEKIRERKRRGRRE